jgi:hypothetical protein
MPVSEKQLEANRRNAQLSTGPRSEEGKARSAMNGFCNSSLGNLTAVMTTEDRLSQNEFVRDYIADLNPQGAVELQMARTLALDNWRLNRIKAVEENIFAWGYEVKPGVKAQSDIPEIENALAHANSFLVHADRINKISLYEARLNRCIARNMELLMERQAARLAAHKPIESTQKTQPLTRRNGFAYVNSQPTASPDREATEILTEAA